jgi:hypothetical protein
LKNEGKETEADGDWNEALGEYGETVVMTGRYRRLDKVLGDFRFGILF